MVRGKIGSENFCNNMSVKLTAKFHQSRDKLAVKHFAATGPANSHQTHGKCVHTFSAKFYTRIHAYSCKHTGIHASSCNYIGINTYNSHKYT
jgi:hypothetical protein